MCHRRPFDHMDWRGYVTLTGTPFPNRQVRGPVGTIHQPLQGHIPLRENVSPPLREEERRRELNPGQSMLIDLLVPLSHNA